MEDIHFPPGYLFFKDINPQVIFNSRFVTKLAYTDSGKLVDNPNITKEFIDNTIRSSMADIKNHSSVKKYNRFIPVNPLAIPKGTKKTCEVCPNRALLACKNCTVTYYCSVEHSDLDECHDKLCERIKVVRSPSVFKLTSIERIRIEGQKLLIKERILNELITQSYWYLSKKQFKSAMSSLFQCIKYVFEVYDLDNCISPLITVHTGIGQAQIGLNDLKGAEKSITNAGTFIHKSESVHAGENVAIYRCQLHKTEALFFFFRKRYSEAIYHYAKVIICVTECFHPTHIRTALPYFNLSSCFLAIGRTVEGESMMTFSIQVLFDNLFDALNKKIPEFSIFQAQLADDNPMLSLYVEMEVAEMLIGVRSYISFRDQTEVGLRVLICEAIFAFSQKRFYDLRSNVRKLLHKIDEHKHPKMYSAYKSMRQVMSHQFIGYDK